MRDFRKLAEERLAQSRERAVRLAPVRRQMRAEVREFQEHREELKQGLAVATESRELVEANIPGFYPTPPWLARRMVEIAGITTDHRVLEPSAGKGNIAAEIRGAGVEPVVIELNAQLAGVLKKNGYQVINGDFLEHRGTHYDRILMNPPFERMQDIDHLQHAFALLNDGGCVVAILSEGCFFRQDRKTVDFRRWLSGVGAWDEQLPEDTFYQSERRTGVRTRLVVIEKKGK